MDPDSFFSPENSGPDFPEGISFEPDSELAQWFAMLDIEIVFETEEDE